MRHTELLLQLMLQAMPVEYLPFLDGVTSWQRVGARFTSGCLVTSQVLASHRNFCLRCSWQISHRIVAAVA